MVATSATARDGWSSRTAFILAAIGSAVGLGNLVRFPAEAGANGGGAFVLFTSCAIVLIGLPVLLVRDPDRPPRTGGGAGESYRKLAVEIGGRRRRGNWALRSASSRPFPRF